MRSALFPNHRSSGVRGNSARWLELVFLWVLLPGQGCHSDFPYCPVPAAVCHTAGALEEDLCFCDPAAGVLPPPQCYLMIQSGRWQLIEAVEANAPEPPTGDAGRAVATDSPQPVEHPQEKRSLFADFWPAPRNAAAEPLKVAAEPAASVPADAEPVAAEPHRTSADAMGIIAELGPQRSGTGRHEIVPPPALPPAALAVRDDVRDRTRADIPAAVINAEPLLADEREPAVAQTAPRVAKAAPRPFATVPSYVASDDDAADTRAAQTPVMKTTAPKQIASTSAAPLDRTPSDVAPKAMPSTKSLPGRHVADGRAENESAPSALAPVDELPLPEVPLPPAPRPEPLRITAAIESVSGGAAVETQDEAPLPVPSLATAEPALRPAPRPAALNVLENSRPLARAEESDSDSHESAEYRKDRQRRTAGPLQDWEAS